MAKQMWQHEPIVSVVLMSEKTSGLLHSEESAAGTVQWNKTKTLQPSARQTLVSAGEPAVRPEGPAWVGLACLESSGEMDLDSAVRVHVPGPCIT